MFGMAAGRVSERVHLSASINGLQKHMVSPYGAPGEQFIDGIFSSACGCYLFGPHNNHIILLRNKLFVRSQKRRYKCNGKCYKEKTREHLGSVRKF